MSKKFGIAGLQLKRHSTDSKRNLEKFQEVSRGTTEEFPWLDLIFAGEYYLQEHQAGESWREYATVFPNALTDEIGELARELEVWIVPGTLIEKGNEGVYNTVFVFNPDGEIFTRYRKAFPWRPSEDYDYGDSLVVFEIEDFGKIGLSICYDIWFPEVFRTLAWMGAEVVLHPTANPMPDRDTEITLAQAQAVFNQCYVLSLNTVEEIGGGYSAFVDPEGKKLRESGPEESVLTTVVDFDYVSWVREYGTFGNTPVWKSLRDSEFKGAFPVYEDFGDGEVFKNLGELKSRSSLND
ncbi:MAG: carbon-nitrogen hydrolase family protein [Candidatus Thorarchaeota archaeon]|nr:carbon-nitrogen hydrolase family protein [Candidatus Thorarchaeota archaeon]